MTNYIQSANDRVGKIRPPFISSRPLRTLISGSFTFRSKVFSLTLGKENSKLSVCQNAISNGSAASPGYLGSQQPRSAVDFKEGMALPWAGLPRVHVPEARALQLLRPALHGDRLCSALYVRDGPKLRGFGERLQLARLRLEVLLTGS